MTRRPLGRLAALVLALAGSALLCACREGTADSSPSSESRPSAVPHGRPVAEPALPSTDGLVRSCADIDGDGVREIVTAEGTCGPRTGTERDCNRTLVFRSGRSWDVLRRIDEVSFGAHSLDVADSVREREVWLLLLGGLTWEERTDRVGTPSWYLLRDDDVLARLDPERRNEAGHLRQARFVPDVDGDGVHDLVLVFAEHERGCGVCNDRGAWTPRASWSTVSHASGRVFAAHTRESGRPWGAFVELTRPRAGDRMRLVEVVDDAVVFHDLQGGQLVDRWKVRPSRSASARSVQVLGDASAGVLVADPATGVVLEVGSDGERWVMESARAGGQLGFAIRELDDLDGDGRKELAVSEPGRAGTDDVVRRGRVHIVRGSTGASLGVLEASEGVTSFGSSLAFVDDAVNGSFLAVGAGLGPSGAVYVFDLDLLRRLDGGSVEVLPP